MEHKRGNLTTTGFGKVLFDVELETSFWELEEPIFSTEAYDLILGAIFCSFSRRNRCSNGLELRIETVFESASNSTKSKNFIYLFIFLGMRIQHIQIDHCNMIRGHNELKTYVIKNWNYIAKAQEPSSLTEPENKKTRTPPVKINKSRTQIS